jgi:hypothetical protein
VSRESLRVMIPMKSQAAASRKYLEWDKALGATVAFRLDNLVLPSKAVTYAYGRHAAHRVRSAADKGRRRNPQRCR